MERVVFAAGDAFFAFHQAMLSLWSLGPWMPGDSETKLGLGGV